MRRKGEPPGGRYFRSDRFLQNNGAWYFATREPIEVGPFVSRQAAVRAAAELVKMLAQQTSPGAALALIRDFVAFHVPRYNRL